MSFWSEIAGQFSGDTQTEMAEDQILAQQAYMESLVQAQESIGLAGLNPELIKQNRITIIAVLVFLLVALFMIWYLFFRR